MSHKIMLVLLALVVSLLSANLVYTLLDQAIGTKPAVFVAGVVAALVFSHYKRKIGNRTVA